MFINPVGGQGKGVSEFKQHVQPMFDLAEINYNVIVTGEGCSVGVGVRMFLLHYGINEMSLKTEVTACVQCASKWDHMATKLDIVCTV